MGREVHAENSSDGKRQKEKGIRMARGGRFARVRKFSFAVSARAESLPGQARGVYEKSYFHVSDEPNESMLESYSKARGLLDKYLPDCKSIEALSHYEFYSLGYVKTARRFD